MHNIAHSAYQRLRGTAASSPFCIPDWPQHLFPRQGDFARHINRQQQWAVQKFYLLSASSEVQCNRSRDCHTVTLHTRSHLLTDRTPRTQLWQYSTPLFSLIRFYELSNEALINTTCLLFYIPLPHTIYLKATQSTYTKCDIWADAILIKSTHAAETRNTTHPRLQVLTLAEVPLFLYWKLGSKLINRI